MSTIRQLVSSLDTQLKQLPASSSIPLNQVYLWASYFINKFIYLKSGIVDSGEYLFIIPNVGVSVVLPASEDVNLVAGRKYSILPRSILDFEGDRGIEYVTWYNNLDPAHPLATPFMRTTSAKAHRLYLSTYEIPSPSNPYFYRHGKYIGYLGIDDVVVTQVEMGLKCPFDPFSGDYSIDDDISIIDEFADDIQRSVLEMGRFELMMPTDRTVDADQTGTQSKVPTTKITSVNPQPPQIE